MKLDAPSKFQKGDFGSCLFKASGACPGCIKKLTSNSCAKVVIKVYIYFMQRATLYRAKLVSLFTTNMHL